MSENSQESAAEEATGISDEQLPEDLRPSEDNPLAQPLDPEEAKSPEELDMQGGKTPEQSEDGGLSGDDSAGEAEGQSDS